VRRVTVPRMRFLLTIGFVLVLAGGAYVFRDRISGGAGDLKVGDCFDVPTTETDTIKDVQHHPCDESHTAEVILVTDHPAKKGAAVPSDADVRVYLAETCGAARDAYVDPKNADRYDLGAFYPTEEGWAKNERDVTCYLTLLDGSPMTTSAKAA
jgi:Septum formation